jgi:hypothetical protein
MTTAVPPTIDREQGGQLAEFVRAQWSELYARLGERAGEFVEAARGTAAARQLRDPNCVARFVNLCCVFGPRFEQQPDNRWALAILADDRLGDQVKLHQLVARGATELKRRGPEGQQASARLLLADASLLDNASDAAVPRSACDLEAVQIAVADSSWRREYGKAGAGWRLLPLPAGPAALRIADGRTAPRLVSVLAHPAGVEPVALLQVGILAHATCDGDRHPRVTFAGPNGVSTKQGRPACATTWPVHAPPSQPAGNGLGATLLEETAAQPSRLQVSTCRLRDEGVPAGDVDLYVCAYPADQWLFELHRPVAPAWARPARAADPTRSATRTQCRLERDGRELPGAAWAATFDEGLDAALVRGFESLFAAWQGSAREAAMTVAANVLCGSAHLAWGWHEGPMGLAGRPDLHVRGALDLANMLDLSLTGEITLGASRARARLCAKGVLEMKRELQRIGPTPSLQEAIAAAGCRWRFAYRIEFDPVAVAEGALWSDAGPCTGAIVGEVGLRPRPQGGGGWQWHAQMTSEPVTATVGIHDPVVGRTREVVQLLPALTLLDWSAG